MTMAPVAPEAALSPAVDKFFEGLTAAIDRRVGGKAQGFKHDATGNPTGVGYVHGPAGSLSYPGVDPDVFHTLVGFQGLLGQLPVRPSIDSNPLFTVITGVGSDSGEEKTEVCGDAPTAGILSACNLTAPFARYERKTPELEINRLGLRTDRADPMDLRMVGSPIVQSAPFLNGPASNNPGDILTNEISTRMWELSTSLHRLISRQLWTGNPANNNGEAYRELASFPLLVNTGHLDAITGTACPSIDSDVKDFNYGNVSENGADLVNALTYMFRYVRDLAVRTGVNPVRWVFVMRPELFYEISAIWPCAYLTYRCGFGDMDAARLIVDGAEQVRMRDEMRTGSYLLLDGIRVEVVPDDGIPYTTSTTDAGGIPSGAFASDIYLIPMSILGTRAVTYLEHFNYNNPSINSAMAGMEPGAYTVQGPWITTTSRKLWCFSWQTKIEPRLIMRTPWLAGRLQNVVGSPLQMTRSAFPDDPYYVAPGGVTGRPGPSYYVPWAS